MRYICKISFLLVILAISLTHCAKTKGNQRVPGARVMLKHGGEIRGEVLEVDVDGHKVYIRRFLGIPYALPPIEDRRFDIPVAHPGWNGTRRTNKKPPACWQYIYESGFEKNNRGEAMWINNTVMNEDCLYLNVWAPMVPVTGRIEKLPTMVWIHGGGFTRGTSTLDVYDGMHLAATQKVVVVSMQYRLGPFGFFRLNVDAGDTSQRALGNQGLLDQVMALEWVRNNTGYFGGDPELVTIFGQSAGAVSVSLHLLSEKSRNLFKRAIMQSASAYAQGAFTSLGEADRRGRAFVTACGCDQSRGREDILNCMQNVSATVLVKNIFNITHMLCKSRAEKILKNLPYQFGRILQSGIKPCTYSIPFPPVQDNITVPHDLDSMFGDRSSPPEVLLGVNENEGMYFLLHGILVNGSKFLDEDGSVILPDLFNLTVSNSSITEGKMASLVTAQFLQEEMMQDGTYNRPAYFYDLGENATMIEPPLMNRLDALAGDSNFKCPTLKFAEKAAEIENSTVYFYSFEKRTKAFTWPEWVGVMHGYEIEYVFGMPRSKKFQNKFYRFDKDEKKLSDTVMSMWANFARSGNPNQPANGSFLEYEWPSFKTADSTDTRYMVIDEQPRTGKNLRKNFCEFWSEMENASQQNET